MMPSFSPVENCSSEEIELLYFFDDYGAAPLATKESKQPDSIKIQPDCVVF